MADKLTKREERELRIKQAARREVLFDLESSLKVTLSLLPKGQAKRATYGMDMAVRYIVTLREEYQKDKLT